MVFIVAASVSDEYHYAVMNNMNLIIVLELGLFSFCGVTEANFHHKKTSSKNAVVEITGLHHDTLRYCSRRFKPLESESGSLYVAPFVLCPTDCN